MGSLEFVQSLVSRDFRTCHFGHETVGIPFGILNLSLSFGALSNQVTGHELVISGMGSSNISGEPTEIGESNAMI